MSILDVAKYILEKNGAMGVWKLHKLCYYAQAWTLAWDRKPLFNEDFEAWGNGAVSPVLSFHCKDKFIISADMICGDSDNLTQEQRENVDIVLDGYGDKEAYWLRGQIRSEAPWKYAINNPSERRTCRNVIPKDSMGAYYDSL